MLVLSRKKNESIIIDNHIVVSVLSIEGDTVRLGFEAPKEISIYRKEIFEEIQEENKQASQLHFDIKELKKLQK